MNDFYVTDLNEYHIDFIKQEDFERHVSETIKTYDETLNKIDLKKFNANVIDPIKLTFDKALFRKTWNEIIDMEISRQRDKSNTNAIGYFHQNLFALVKGCIIPKQGFDIVFNKEDGTKICVEMKNKHNTMNSSASQKTYINMQNHLLKNPNDECYLVEILAPKSRNIKWELSVDKVHCSDERIRRVSVDHFYKIVTGKEDAFYQICTQLPITINKLISNNQVKTVEKDTVVDELKEKSPNLLKALYLLAFESYLGFEPFDVKLRKLLGDFGDK